MISDDLQRAIAQILKSCPNLEPRRNPSHFSRDHPDFAYSVAAKTLLDRMPRDLLAAWLAEEQGGAGARRQET